MKKRFPTPERTVGDTGTRYRKKRRVNEVTNFSEVVQAAKKRLTNAQVKDAPWIERELDILKRMYSETLEIIRAKMDAKLGDLVFVKHTFALQRVLSFLLPQEIIRLARINKATNKASYVRQLFLSEITIQVIANPVRTSFCWDRTKKWYDLSELPEYLPNGKINKRKKFIMNLVTHVFLRSNITSFPKEYFPNVQSVTISRHDVSFPKYVQEQIVRMAISHDDADGIDDVGGLKSSETKFLKVKHLMLSMDTEHGTRDWNVFPELETIVMDCDSGHLQRNTVPYASLPKKKVKTLILQVELFDIQSAGHQLFVPPLSELGHIEEVRFSLWRFVAQQVQHVKIDSLKTHPFRPNLEEAFPRSKITLTHDVILDKTILQFHNQEYNTEAVTDFFEADFSALGKPPKKNTLGPMPALE